MNSRFPPLLPGHPVEETTAVLRAYLISLKQIEDAFKSADSERWLWWFFGQKLRSLWEEITICDWCWDVREQKLSVSPAFLTALGYPSNGAAASPAEFLDLIHPQDFSRLLEAVRSCSKETFPKNMRARFRFAAETWEWIEFIFEDVELGLNQELSKVKGRFRCEVPLQILDDKERELAQAFEPIFCSHRNLTLQVNNLIRLLSPGSEMQETPRMADIVKEQSSRLMNTENYYLFVKDTSMKYKYIDPQLASHLGVSESDVLGRTDFDLWGKPPNIGPDPFTNLLRGLPVRVGQVRLVNGSPVGFADTLYPVRDSYGKITFFFGRCGDSSKLDKLSDLPCHESPTSISVAMQAALDAAQLIADADIEVLITGETGSGKDWLARYIHEHSPRKDRAYFPINLAAIPSELAESELFGHEPGAFTGAKDKKKGLLELAQGGTLLLNEIGELSLPIQSKLLTFLDTKKFVRVGGTKPIEVNARLIAATHRDLEIEMAEGRFLPPLFYRLNVWSIWVPPLRERIKDIPVLVRELLIKLAKKDGLQSVPRIDTEAIDKLQGYPWPGNVRELQTVLKRAIILSAGSKIRARSIDFKRKKEKGLREDSASRSESSHPEESTERALSISTDLALRPATDLSDKEFKEMYEEVCVRMHDEEPKGVRGSAEAIRTVLGCSREHVSRTIKRLGCPGVRKGRISDTALKAIVAQLESWLARHGLG